MHFRPTQKSEALCVAQRFVWMERLLPLIAEVVVEDIPRVGVVAVAAVIGIAAVILVLLRAF